MDLKLFALNASRELGAAHEAIVRRTVLNAFGLICINLE